MDNQAFAARVVEAVKGHVERAVAPLVAEIVALKSALEVERDKVRHLVELHPDFDSVEALIDKAFTERSQVGAAVKEGRDGIDGKDGRDGVDGKDGRDGVDGKDGAAAPVVAGAVKDHTGELVLTLTDGTILRTGIVDGSHGKNGDAGRDGFRLEDFDSEVRDGGRTLVLSFEAGDIKHTVEHQLDVVLDRGVYRVDQKYLPGDGATWQGSWWIAQRETMSRPGEGDDWRLAVKKGRDGRDADMEKIHARVDARMAEIEAVLIKRIDMGQARRSGES